MAWGNAMQRDVAAAWRLGRQQRRSTGGLAQRDRMKQIDRATFFIAHAAE